MPSQLTDADRLHWSLHVIVITIVVVTTIAVDPC